MLKEESLLKIISISKKHASQIMLPEMSKTQDENSLVRRIARGLLNGTIVPEGWLWKQKLIDSGVSLRNTIGHGEYVASSRLFLIKLGNHVYFYPAINGFDFEKIPQIFV